MNLYMTRGEARDYFTGRIDPDCLEEFLNKLFSDRALLAEASKRKQEEELKPVIEALKRYGVI